MNVTEVAASLGMTKSAVRKAIVRGRLVSRARRGHYGPYEYVVEPEEVERYRVENRKPRIDWSNVVMDEGDEAPQ